MPLLSLDSLEFRTPLVDFPKRDGTSLGLLMSAVWQRRLRSLWDYVQNQNRIINVTADRNVTVADTRAMLICNGTLTLSLPILSRPGEKYYAFNNGVGVITVAGTVNGNPAGYQLINPYQYAEFTSLDGEVWIVTGNN